MHLVHRGVDVYYEVTNNCNMNKYLFTYIFKFILGAKSSNIRFYFVYWDICFYEICLVICSLFVVYT